MEDEHDHLIGFIQAHEYIPYVATAVYLVSYFASQLLKATPRAPIPQNGLLMRTLHGITVLYSLYGLFLTFTVNYMYDEACSPLLLNWNWFPIIFFGVFNLLHSLPLFWRGTRITLLHIFAQVQFLWLFWYAFQTDMMPYLRFFLQCHFFQTAVIHLYYFTTIRSLMTILTPLQMLVMISNFILALRGYFNCGTTITVWVLGSQVMMFVMFASFYYKTDFGVSRSGRVPPRMEVQPEEKSIFDYQNIKRLIPKLTTVKAGGIRPLYPEIVKQITETMIELEFKDRSQYFDWDGVS